VVDFLKYYLNDGQTLVDEVGYVRVDPETLKKSQDALQAAIDKLK
jgi:hypothetical protein